MNYEITNKIISVLAVGIMGGSLFEASEKVDTKYLDKVPNDIPALFKECPLFIS